MKKILFLLLFISLNLFGQSVTISPSNLTRERTGGFEDIVIRSYANWVGSPSISGYMVGGTKSSPTYPPNDINLLNLNGGGYYNGGFYKSSSSISFKTTQNWLNNAIGSKIIFTTTENNSDTPIERMVINHNGSVGIGLTSPNQILDINGRMRIRHTPGFTSGVWMSNSTNSLSDADGAFIGLENDNQAGIWINNAWRFGFNRNGNAVITGFTQLGNSTPAGASPGATAPAIKTLKLTGTTAGTAGASISVDHGLGNRLKILGYTVLVVGTSAVSYPPEYTYNGGYQYSTTCTNTQILIINSHLNSANIYNKAFTVLITYEE